MARPRLGRRRKGQYLPACRFIIYREVLRPHTDGHCYEVGRVDFGLFKNDAYGLKGYLAIAQWLPSWAGLPSQIGFYINFSNPSLRFGDVSGYEPIVPLTGLDYLAARAIWAT